MASAAHVHKRASQVEISSRPLDRVTEFPELSNLSAQSPAFFLDANIIGCADGRAHPIQPSCSAPRRKQIIFSTQFTTPVSYSPSTCASRRPLTLDTPLAQRRLLREHLLAAGDRPPSSSPAADVCRTVDEIENRFYSPSMSLTNASSPKRRSSLFPRQPRPFWMNLQRPLATSTW